MPALSIHHCKCATSATSIATETNMCGGSPPTPCCAHTKQWSSTQFGSAGKPEAGPGLQRSVWESIIFTTRFASHHSQPNQKGFAPSPNLPRAKLSGPEKQEWCSAAHPAPIHTCTCTAASGQGLVHYPALLQAQRCQNQKH